MDSRTRVKLTIQHKEPDRVPLDVWGSASRIHTSRYISLAAELGLTLGDRIRPGTTTEYVDYALADILGSDFRHISIGGPSNFASHYDADGNKIDEWGIGKRLVALSNTVTFHPLPEADRERLRKYPWPTPRDPGRIKGLAEQAGKYYEETDKAITATTATSGLFFDFGQYLCGTEEFLINLYEEEEFCDALIDKLLELFIELHLYYLEPIAPYLEWVEFASDLGTQQAQFLSTAMFRRYFKSPMKQLFSAVKRAYPHLKIFLHSCGSIINLIPELIDCGVDILNPLQPLAAGMDAYAIKREYGSSLVFHGGVDIQQAMPGTPEQVRADVRRCIDALAPGGGYILSPANHIQSDVPNRNILELYRCAKELGVYQREGREEEWRQRS